LYYLCKSMHILIKWLISAISIIFSAYLIPGVNVSGFWAALWLALFLGLINVTLRPLLLIFTLPINVLTLGLFTFIINGVIILLASSVLKGFSVSGFLVACGFSIVLSIIGYILNVVFGTKS